MVFPLRLSQASHFQDKIPKKSLALGKYQPPKIKKKPLGIWNRWNRQIKRPWLRGILGAHIITRLQGRSAAFGALEIEDPGRDEIIMATVFPTPSIAESNVNTISASPICEMRLFVASHTWRPPEVPCLGGDLKMSSIFFWNSSILPFTSGSSLASFSIWLNSPSLIICKSICGCLEMGSQGIPSRHHSFQVSSSHGRPWLDDTCKYPH